MNAKRTNCPIHGNQGIGLVCVHAAIATDSDHRAGFFINDNTDLARPDAWCGACEDLLCKDGWSEQWFDAADFKIFCASCWDIAKERLSVAPENEA